MSREPGKAIKTTDETTDETSRRTGKKDIPQSSNQGQAEQVVPEITILEYESIETTDRERGGGLKEIEEFQTESVSERQQDVTEDKDSGSPNCRKTKGIPKTETTSDKEYRQKRIHKLQKKPVECVEREGERELLESRSTKD
jgi:hypothetical protein